MSNPATDLWSSLNPRSDLYRHPLKVWPYTWASLGWFAAAWATMVVILTAVGFAITTWLEGSALGERELDINEWFEERRTEQLNTVANAASYPSDTPVAIGVLVVLLIAAPFVWKRWHDWAFLLGALALESATYGASNFLVDRERPPVDRLEEIVTASFPSGHIGAATVLYIGFLVLARWHTVNRVVIGLFAVLAPIIIVAVSISRLYLGVHYLTDLFAGAFMGAGSVAAAMWIARRGLADEVASTPEPEPPHTAALDTTSTGQA